MKMVPLPVLNKDGQGRSLRAIPPPEGFDTF